MAEAVAQRDLGVEVLLVAAIARHEGDDDVRPALLGADVGLRVGPAAVELLEDLVARVAPPRAVALHLPLAAQLLGRGEEDADVEAVAQGLRVVAQQPLDDRELARLDVHGGPERAVLVLVDGLEDGPSAAHVREVLLHDVEVVAVGVQRA